MPLPSFKYLPHIIISLTILISFFLKVDKINLEIQGKHTWRQSMTSLNIRNFVRNDSNIFNPRGGHFNSDSCNIRRMEFPLMQWVIAMVQKVTGEKIWVTRLIILFIGFISLIGIYLLTNLLFKNKILSALSVWTFSFFPVFFYQTLNPIPDNLALCFSIWFLYNFFKNEKKVSMRSIVFSSILLSTAALVKLPFILFGILPLLSLIFNVFRSKLKVSSYHLKYAFIFILFPLNVYFWYNWVIPTWEGNNITLGILDNSVDLNQYMQFLKSQLTINIPQVVINLPSTLLVIIGIFLSLKNKKLKSPNVLFLGAGLLLLTLYILFTLKQLREGHDYYFLPFLPFFLLAIIYAIKQISVFKFGKLLTPLIIISMPFFCWNTTKDYWNIEYSFFNKDFFEYRSELIDIVPQGTMCIMINDNSNCIVPYTIDKLGYVFRNNHLPINWIKDMINRNVVSYMYSDSRQIESQTGFEDCIEELVGEFGTIKVFKLKKQTFE